MTSELMKPSTRGVLIRPVSHPLVLVLCSLFAVLYGVWLLPETVFIRHFCMVVGAVLSLFIIYPNKSLLLKKEALPIWLLVLLLAWVTLHLFFFANEFEWQLDEYTRIWKKIAVSLVFAVGLGIALISQSGDAKNTRRYWQIIYLGFLLPALIYFVKSLATYCLPLYGYVIPKYLLLSPDALGNPLGIARAVYVFFCLPALSMAVGAILHSIQSNNFRFRDSAVYLLTIPATSLIFYLENDRLGTVFGFFLMVIMAVFVSKTWISRVNHKLVGAIVLTLLASFSILVKGIKQNPQWEQLMADAKVAIQVDRYDHWKNRAKGYPTNQNGLTPTDSNYSRIAWAIVGGRLALENPLGYGKMSLSFHSLGKKKWPDSELSWTHSAWLDFTLGYGFPGLGLLGLAACLAMWNSSKAVFPWALIGSWCLGIMSAVLLVKEISFEAPINTFIFVIAFASTLSLKNWVLGTAHNVDHKSS